VGVEKNKKYCMENEKFLFIAAERDWRDPAAGVLDPGAPVIGGHPWRLGRLRLFSSRPSVRLERPVLLSETCDRF